MTGNSYKEPEYSEPIAELEQPEKKKKRKANPVVRGFQSVLDGTILTGDKVMKGIPFVFYVTLLLVLYIANTYYAEKKIIEIEKIKREIKELRSESITTKSNLMFYSRQSEVLKRILPYGIVESLIPPRKIFVQDDTTGKATVK